VIDRITSAANPRSIERVPAGAEFDFEMIYNVFTKEDKENLRHVLKAQELLEHDYLGASGSRGYGKIVFEDIKVYWNSKEDYETGDVEKRSINGDNTTVATILHEFHHLVKEIH
jgi:CRISPR-associated protein Csm3